jgi:RNA-directed DNA polymerase
MATRTTTTRATRIELAPSAYQAAHSHAAPSFDELKKAYTDCLKNKSTKPTAKAFAENLESNLQSLYAELMDGSYRPGRSVCFIVTRPKPREVWAADFRDRVVHHLLYNHLADRAHASFIADTCACIPGRGTLYAARRLEAKIRSATENWSKPVWYLKCDLANFFVTIDKQILWAQLAARIDEPWWQWLAHTVLFHDPRQDFELRGSPSLLQLVPLHKRLTNQPAHLGLPIGNLSSQFFANIHLDALDQHAKHQIGARHYIRYVDDFILLHESPQWLNAARVEIESFLPRVLHARLNPKKTILQPVARGVDFVGHVIKPWHTSARRRTVRQAVSRLRTMDACDVYASANSYFGLLRQASSGHTDRARVARAVLDRGYVVNKAFTKTYRKGQG